MEHEAVTPTGAPIKGEIVHVNDLSSFYIVPAGGADKKMQSEVAAAVSQCKDEQSLQKRRIYIAQWPEDKKWYRAKVEQVHPGGGSWSRRGLLERFFFGVIFSGGFFQGDPKARVDL